MSLPAIINVIANTANNKNTLTISIEGAVPFDIPIADTDVYVGGISGNDVIVRWTDVDFIQYNYQQYNNPSGASAAAVQAAIAALLTLPLGGGATPGLPFTIVLSCAATSFTVAATTTYFFGSRFGIAPVQSSGSGDTGGHFVVYIPANCTIKQASVSAGYISGPSANISCSVYLRKNNAGTNVLVDNGVNLSEQNYNSNKAITIACNAGDYIEGIFVAGDWGSSPPTGMFVTLTLYCD